MQASTEDVGLVLAVGSVMAVIGGILTAVVDKKYSHTTIIVSLSVINAAVCLVWQASTTPRHSLVSLPFTSCFGT